MNPTYGGTSLARRIVGISIGHAPEDLLRRGFGVEHLREMLRQVVRPIVLHGASIACGGTWEDRSDNFTYDLLRLISAELQDQQGAGIDTESDELPPIGLLYNHLAWPCYLSVTAATEALWIDCCRIVRVTQEAAGFGPGEVVADDARGRDPLRTAFNAATTMSTMRRRIMMEPMRVDSLSRCLSPSPAVPKVRGRRNSPHRAESLSSLPEHSRTIHPVLARVVLGGQVTGFSGAMPGIFEEALATLESQRPLYIIGGFGGAAGFLARALLNTGKARLQEFTAAFHSSHTPVWAKLLKAHQKFTAPLGIVAPDKALAKLWSLLQRKGRPFEAVLHNGLSDAENRRLLETTDVREAGQLVLEGLQRVQKV